MILFNNYFSNFLTAYLQDKVLDYVVPAVCDRGVFEDIADLECN